MIFVLFYCAFCFAHFCVSCMHGFAISHYPVFLFLFLFLLFFFFFSRKRFPKFVFQNCLYLVLDGNTVNSSICSSMSMSSKDMSPVFSYTLHIIYFCLFVCIYFLFRFPKFRNSVFILFYFILFILHASLFALPSHVPSSLFQSSFLNTPLSQFALFRCGNFCSGSPCPQRGLPHKKKFCRVLASPRAGLVSQYINEMEFLALFFVCLLRGMFIEVECLLVRCL